MVEQDVFSTRDEMMELLKTGNPGVIVIKYGAEWCGPCKKIEEFVKQNMAMMPENIRCITIDIDEAFDVYAFLKSKKLVSGIPAILAYYQGNVSYVPDQVVLGTDTNEIKTLFDTCSKKILP